MNNIYANARERALASFNWVDLNLVLMAWHGAYVFDETDLTTADIVALGGVLDGVSLPLTNVLARPGGYARTDPALFPLMPVGPEVTFLTLVEDVGIAGQEKNILYMDEALGLPFVPNGLDQIIQPDWLERRGWFRP